MKFGNKERVRAFMRQFFKGFLIGGGICLVLFVAIARVNPPETTNAPAAEGSADLPDNETGENTETNAE